MALLRPSLTLVLDLDKRLATQETILELKRCYTYIGVPVIRSHETPGGDDAPLESRARILVGLGTRQYLHGDDEGADELWESVVEPWIGNMLRKIGCNMRAFNVRQRKIGLPEVVFGRVDVELQGGELVVSLHTDPQSFVPEALSAQVGLARTLLNEGTLAQAACVLMPSDASYEEQCATALALWEEEHPAPGETPEEGGADEEASEPEQRELTREEWLELDRQAKSYENTAVPPTDSNTLPSIPRKEQPEAEQFAFEVDYTLWSVVDAEGTVRTFNAVTREFEG